MTRLKYFFLSKLRGPLGLSILSILFTRRLGRLVSRPVKMKFQTSFSRSETVMTEMDRHLISRLFKFWNSVKESKYLPDLGNSLWSEIQSDQIELQVLLDEGDSERIYKYLISSPTQSISNGVLQGKNETKMLRINPRYRNLQSRITVNRFANLIEGIGRGSLVQNPEQGEWGVNKCYRLDEAFKFLDEEFGFAVQAPIIFNGLLQTSIGNRNFNQVDIMALNGSLQIRNTLRSSASKSILEIGGGTGFTAYWCNRLGLGPIYIIDLPHVALLQAFYLIKALPNARVLLFGEEVTGEHPDITIYPHWAFNILPLVSPTLVFNQDSFSEMATTMVQKYLRWITDVKSSYLLSINHESRATYNATLEQQVNVSSLIQTEMAFKPISRHRNWIRSGYVDQLWELK